ncbi:MAG TPA: glycosyltransferase family 4 protein [Flavilitoribacter sp.]|nr:glycosyltransferase family 4 protein [Flavilitoribacter sp.]
MKILYIVPNPAREGGVSRSISRVVRQLKLMKNDVEVFCPDFEAAAEKKISPMERFYAEMQGEQMQTWTQRCLERIGLVKPDLLVGYFGRNAAFCAVAAGRLAGLPVVASLRGNDVNLDFFSAMYSSRIDFTIRHATRVTTVSSEMKTKVKAWYDRDATFIANSVDKSLFYRDQSGAERLKAKWDLDDRPVVGLLGEFKPARGVHLLKELKEELSQVQTVIIGTVRKQYESLVPDWAIRVPYIRNQDDLRAAYSLCDLVLQPSVNDGMPNVVLEAMACECTVLASPVGGLCDLIRDGKNGLLCKDLEAWKTGITGLLLHPRRELGVQARADTSAPVDEAQSFLKVFKSAYEG